MNSKMKLMCAFCKAPIEVNHVHEVRHLLRVGCSICAHRQFYVAEEWRPGALYANTGNVTGPCEVCGGNFARHTFRSVKMCDQHFGDALGKSLLGILGGR